AGPQHMSPAQPGTQGHGDDTVERVERMLHEPEASAGEHRGRDPWPAAAAKYDDAGPALKISCGNSSRCRPIPGSALRTGRRSYGCSSATIERGRHPARVRGAAPDPIATGPRAGAVASWQQGSLL